MRDANEGVRGRHVQIVNGSAKLRECLNASLAP